MNKKEFESFAKEIANKIESPYLILLNGPLGAGKTFFTSKLVDALGGDKVSSPTYTIMNEYESTKGNIVHIDAYRLETEKELESINLFEYLEDNIVIIEWADKIKKYLPKANLEMKIEYDGDERKIECVF